jgi:hypothetical protein
MLTTTQKGAIAETAIAHEAVKLGIGVYKPLADERADFVFDLGDRLIRVQCKWARSKNNGFIVGLYSARRTRDGLRRTLYTSREIDAFAVYSPETGRCYFLDIAEFAGQSEVRLRLGEARNGQKARIRWAKNYEFGATLGAVPGPIAQLGERRHGMAEAVGSSPTGSTLF